MSTDNLKQAEKEAAKAKKKAEKAARKAEKMKDKARRKALKDGTLKAALDEAPTDPNAPDPLRPRTEEELKVELEDLRAGHIEKISADDWTFMLSWKEEDQYNNYRIDKINELREEVAAWRRKARRMG